MEPTMGARNTTKARRKPKQARSVSAVDAILTATTWVLAERGFARTTTNEIAEVAGVNVGTLYRYFPSKDAIIGELIEREARATLQSVEQVLTDGRAMSTEAVLHALVTTMVDERRLDARVHRELVEQVGRSNRVSVLRNLEHDIAARLLAFMRERSGTEPHVDAPVSAFIVLHAVEALVHAIVFLRPPNVGREEAIDAAVRLVARFLEP
jgi:AcrR family transcriptional regulator